MRKTFSTGTLLGAALTLPLVAVSYLGWKAADLPFIPFDLFDWTTRALPGGVATLAVDLMVRLTSALPFRTAVTAKTIEETLAIALVTAAGMLLSGGLLVLLEQSHEPATLPGGVTGVALGGLAVVAEQELNRLTSPGAVSSGLFVFVTCLAWGLAFGWCADRMRGPAATAVAVPPSAVSVPARRVFLARVGRVTASLTALGAAAGALVARSRVVVAVARWSASHALPNAAASVVPAPGTRAEFTALEQHYRIDAVTRPPAISGSRWRLRVRGLVETPLALSLDELQGFEPLHQFVTLSCISNPVGGDLIGTTRWTGVSLGRLVRDWRLAPNASHLKLTAADGFSEVVSLETIANDPRVMLAYAWDGVPLAVEHGFPLRLYVPDLYGMKQPKWIQTVEVLDHWEPGYWVERGWDKEGRVRSFAALDIVAPAAPSSPGPAVALGTTAIGGIAHAGVRGISKVEVQVDGGEWQQAKLREPLSATSWVLWRLDVALSPGDHSVSVRSDEGDGRSQTSAIQTRRVRV